MIIRTHFFKVHRFEKEVVALEIRGEDAFCVYPAVLNTLFSRYWEIYLYTDYVNM